MGRRRVLAHSPLVVLIGILLGNGFVSPAPGQLKPLDAYFSAVQ